MATSIAMKSGLSELESEIIELANAQFESDEYRHLLNLPFTIKRAQHYTIQRTHWGDNRRDCWAYVQAACPMSVKPLIWEHEREELEGSSARGLEDHHTLGVKEGAALGLTAGDFECHPPFDGAMTCMHAWSHLAKNSHWLTALAASAALELSNSEQILREGSMSRRIAFKINRELGVPIEKQVCNNEHMVADVEHGRLLMNVAESHVHTAEDLRLIREGLHKSWAIERVWKGLLARHLESIS